MILLNQSGTVYKPGQTMNSPEGSNYRLLGRTQAFEKIGLAEYFISLLTHHSKKTLIEFFLGEQDTISKALAPVAAGLNIENIMAPEAFGSNPELSSTVDKAISAGVSNLLLQDLPKTVKFRKLSRIINFAALLRVYGVGSEDKTPKIFVTFKNHSNAAVRTMSNKSIVKAEQQLWLFMADKMADEACLVDLGKTKEDRKYFLVKSLFSESKRTQLRSQKKPIKDTIVADSYLPDRFVKKIAENCQLMDQDNTFVIDAYFLDTLKYMYLPPNRNATLPWEDFWERLYKDFGIIAGVRDGDAERLTQGKWRADQVAFEANKAFAEALGIEAGVLFLFGDGIGELRHQEILG
jgi:hypothetical protein